ncbi:18108_t:CDS:2, partial [Acaulospora morrowiae]
MNFFKSKPSPPAYETVIPEENANFLSRIIFWWVGDLMRLGYKRPLEKEDLYLMNDRRLTENLAVKFDVEWKKELNKVGTKKNPSLWKALNRTVGRKFWIGGFYRLCGDALQVTSPLMIQKILIFVATAYFSNIFKFPEPKASDGYIYIVGLFLMQMGYTFFNNSFFYKSMETGFLVRSILINAIYRKAMVLSGKARALFTVGKITNMMSTDPTRLDFAAGYVHIMWAAPLETFVALGLLIKNLGVSALAGFALLIVMGPVQGKVMKSLQNGRKKALKLTDERVKLTQEILQGIRVIKYYAWEESFLDTLSKLRTKEIKYTRFLLIMRSWIMGFSMVLPVFASILSFVVYSLRGGELTADIVFSS